MLTLYLSTRYCLRVPNFDEATFPGGTRTQICFRVVEKKLPWELVPHYIIQLYINVLVFNFILIPLNLSVSYPEYLRDHTNGLAVRSCAYVHVNLQPRFASDHSFPPS